VKLGLIYFGLFFAVTTPTRQPKKQFPDQLNKMSPLMTGDNTLAVFNPSNGEKITSIAADSTSEALEKIERAHQYFSNKKHLPLHQRVSFLEKLIAALLEQQSEIVAIMINEGGKPRTDSVSEFNRAIEGIKVAISTISDNTGHVIPLGSNAWSAERNASTQVFPRGVVLAFSAFNHPLNLIVHQIIPAFATNCPCVIKPAPDTPLSCLKLVEIMHSIGIPKESVQTVITQDVNVASAMVASDKISFFSFIGSAKIGWMLRSKLKPGVRCALEHGGIAPAIVSQHADLSIAAGSITKGGLYHAGQVCVSTQRVYVDQQVSDKFVELLVAHIAQLKVGDADDKQVDVGPLIRAGEIDRIDSWVQEAINMGAACPIGGNRINGVKAGNFYAPTLLINPPSNATVSQQEIFGPVICVYSYKKFEDALIQANNPEFAFHASIYTDKLAEVYQAYNALETSALMVNEHTAFRDDAMPFAGLKQSGLGTGGIPYTIEEMQYQKMLVIKQ
jgi:acyl-CoA reductase-like NAD-dependent aldehyde dehydrogenase